MKTVSYDIIIVGGGMVGLALASALAKETTLSIAILESQTGFSTWSSDDYHHRVSAIALSTQRIFKALQVWDAIQQKRISPFTQIDVWDAASRGEINFDCKEIGETVLGYIIENNAMHEALLQRVQTYPQIEFISAVKLISFQNKESHVELISEAGDVFKAKLAVAADGPRSWLRAQAGIITHQKAYDQEAIVATVHTSLPHQKIARQIFLHTGPLAFLPLAEANVSSIVWSNSVASAHRLHSLDSEQFKSELANAFSHRLGDILDIGERYAFPLSKQQAENYIKQRVVLVGDAAHIVHPLAGQGVNIGMLDAVSLAEVIKNACESQRDFASLTTLRRYERWRKADNLAMLRGIDLLKTLFASDQKTISNLRGLGLNMTNRMGWIKNFFTKQAVGDRAGLPKMAARS